MKVILIIVFDIYSTSIATKLYSISFMYIVLFSSKDISVLILVVYFVGFLSLLPYITVFKGLEINNTLGVVYRGLVLFLSCVIFLGAFFIYKDKANLKVILLVIFR